MTRERRRGVLSIDEGTTGTRAAVVLDDGGAAPAAYLPISVASPDHLRVEQDATEIWVNTVRVCREALDWAAAHRVEIAGVSISTQRATVLLWDTVTGAPLSRAVVWQDRRYARRLPEWEEEWDRRLIEHTGRPVGSRAPLLWAAEEIAGNPAARRAHDEGRLAFGSIDSWLVWKLTGGARHVVSATNAVALGAYDLRTGDWHEPWVDFLGCPRDVLPRIVDEDGDLGAADPAVLGAELPVLSVMGDQHAAMIALGAHRPGQATCVHGTGTFLDAVAGDRPPAPRRPVPGVLTLVGWRSGGVPVFSLEGYAATTGSAVRWLCEEIGLFESPRRLAELAREHPGAARVRFVPALAGLRTPVWSPEATGVLTGLSLSTTRAELARGVLDGFAHSVCDLIEGLEAVMGGPIGELICGGGLATSDVLMAAQADLAGRPVRRALGHETASLRGAAYLGGVRAGLWPSVAAAVAAQPPGPVFEPASSDGERREARAAWRDLLSRHVAAGTEPRPEARTEPHRQEESPS
ncbi:FGGY family carbohydrate kinase [Nonomuraea roseoviolacea]|uniref:Glycerol kinase n=1 Tax=Nonomuraea roseoviolacea subsp. carminata TaxID=160689 RepID=A0ABT1KC61_9ACTN|nr:FGGY family carbohydrate kinase [Nonomuraea roseoviolacea]MCP2351598.1 glycerol kinase [Nonomuraea roseoviolacea subsp. carminata]